MEEFEKASATHIVSDTKVTRNSKLFARSTRNICIIGRKKCLIICLTETSGVFISPTLNELP